RIVIHFKLTIDLKHFPTRPEVETEAAQTPIDIVTLLFQHSQALPARLAMDDRGSLTFRFTAHIVHFQCQNGQTIEEIARGFRVQFWIGEKPGVVLIEIGKQPGIELLNVVMTLLVEGVNGAFTLGDDMISGARPTHTVLDVPQTKVVHMQLVRPGESWHRAPWHGEEWCFWLLCPVLCQAPISGDNVQHSTQCIR